LFFVFTPPPPPRELKTQPKGEIMKKLVLACLLIAVMLSGCAKHIDVPLVWTPTNDIYDTGASTLSGSYSHQYRVAAFVDSRENKKEIARNIEVVR
jgi:hypothetical protein